MIPKTLTDFVLKVLPYVVCAAIIGGAIWYYQHQLKASYEQGYDDGISYQKDVQAKADKVETDRRNKEKEDIERDAQSRIEQSQADAAFASATSDRLHSELDRISNLARNSTSSVATGKTTYEVVVMLADMLSESQRAYVATAAEADNYYDSGLTCENQYDSLRNKYENSKKVTSNDSSSN